MNRETYNLIVSEIMMELLNNRVPSDDLIIRYKSVFENDNVANKELWYTNAISYISKTVTKLKSKYKTEEVEYLINETLLKMNTLISPFNVKFFKSYLLRIKDVEDLQIVERTEKIKIINDLLALGPINNCIIEIYLLNKLLSFYLIDSEKYFDEIAELSDRIKLLTQERDSLPTEINRP